MLNVAETDTLSKPAALLFGTAPFQGSAAWFDVVAATAIPAGCRAVFLTAEESGRPVGCWPMLRGVDGRLSSLTCPYTCLYTPVFGTDEASRAVGRVLRRQGLVRLEAMDGTAQPALMDSLRKAGLIVLAFDHFGNWHEAGGDWPSYLARRPGSLRETLRRRLRAVTDGSLVPEFAATDALLPAYEEVYAASWKVPEPFPDFARRFLHTAAQAGILRMAVLRHEGRAVAAQYWTVEAGVATVLKLAHDDTLRALSPGTVLTALSLQHIFARDPVHTVDFGRGDDDYKQLWASQRRQRVGWLLANPLHPAGAMAIARHVAGRIRRPIALRIAKRRQAS